MKSWINNFLLTVVACLLFAVPVFAARQGSIRLLKVEKPAMLIFVADQEGIPTEPFAGTVEKLSQSDLTPEVAKKFYQRVQERELSGITGAPDENKEISFTALEEGWYLVYSTEEQAEFAPFLICMPMTVGDQTEYDIQAEPKLDSPTEPPIPTNPTEPEPNIPQTGAILWPKYLLLSLGVIAIVAGLIEVVGGREKRYE